MGFWLITIAALSQAAPPPPDTVLIAPPAVRETMRPWIAYRQSQGHRVGFLSSDYSAKEIREAIRASAKSGRLKNLVLVGDARDPDAKPAGAALTTPVALTTAKVNVKFGSEEDIASDNWYADLDDDDVPDLTVGRLTADSPEELSRIVEKILRYERSPPSGEWLRRVNFVAGVGGFGSLVDTVVENATKKFLCDGIPASYRTSMTFGNWRSPYCPDPRRFHETAVERFNEGCVFWVYLGHGHAAFLDRVIVPGASYHILGSRDAAKLKTEHGSPVAVMLACYTGAIDFPHDCLGEALLRSEGGPVAVLAGSRVTMPYAMSVLGTSMMHEYFQKRRATLGEVLLHAKRRMLQADPQDTNRQLLDTLAVTLSSSKDELGSELREHLHLFNLLGDPLLRLHHPNDVSLRFADNADSGDTVEIRGVAPIAGRCVLELCCRRDRNKEAPGPRMELVAASGNWELLQTSYQQANDSVWTRREFTIETAGEFQTQLAIPKLAHGPCHVTAYVSGTERHAMGSANLFIRRAENSPAPRVTRKPSQSLAD